MSEHTHEHNHTHACNCPDVQTGSDKDETIALLRYMIHHNQHHADELYDIANKLDGIAKEDVHAAVILLEQSNSKLEAALKAAEGT